MGRLERLLKLRTQSLRATEEQSGESCEPHGRI